MHGNVGEWCLDYHQIGYAGAPKDGSAWAAPRRRAREKSDDMRIAHGGGWFDGYDQCRSAHRGSNEVDTRNASNGFRVVEKQLDPKHPFHEMPLWSVSDKANKVVEAFLASALPIPAGFDGMGSRR